jgi:hypothetical protein
MLRTNTLQAFDLIGDDVATEIGRSIKQFENYLASDDQSDSLLSALNHINKLKGIFTLLDARGPLTLINEILVVAEQLPLVDKKSRNLMETLSISLLRLQRYLEHVGKKSDDMPELLLPAINSLRKQLGKQSLLESSFFKVDLERRRPDSPIDLAENRQSPKSRYYRKMYHIGLIEVLRRTSIKGGLKMMQRALQNLDDGLRLSNSHDLWWISEVLMDSFIEKKLQLTSERLKIFTRIDYQIKQLDQGNAETKEQSKRKAIDLTKEALYLSTISHQDSLKRSDLLDYFELKEPVIKEQQLRVERDEYNGPSESDFSAITDSLMSELSEIELLMCRLSHKVIQTKLQKQTLEKMLRLKKMLFILKEETQIIRLSMGISLIENTIECRSAMQEKDIEFLNVVLDNISTALTLARQSNNLGSQETRRARLSDEMESIRSDAHQAIKSLMETMANFMANNRKTLLLKGVPNLLDKVLDSFTKLKIPRAAQQVVASRQYFSNYLQQNPHSTPEESIQYFADIIGGLEFYLDTMAFTAHPSEQTLEFIDSSLDSLRKTTR